MRVAFYTFPHLLDAALCWAREVAGLVDLHLVLEIEPDAWCPLLESMPKIPGGGVVPAEPALLPRFPTGVVRYWQACSSFVLVNHKSRRSIHPDTIPVSYRAVRYLRSLRADVIHFDDVSLRLGLLRPLLPRVDVLNLHDPRVHPGESDWRRSVARSLFFRHVRRFRLLNGALLDEFAQRYRVDRDRIDVSRLGPYDIYREWVAGRVEQHERTVLFFGRLSEYKGLEILYRAAMLVADHVPDVRFVVAGREAYGYRAPPAPVLPNGAVIERIDSHVPPARMAELFQRATVVVCPYVDATQSGVALTAFAFERPVVATNVGGMVDYVQNGETGLVVPAGDSTALANAIERVLRDPDLRTSLSRGIVNAAAGRLSWHHIARQTVDDYWRMVRS